VTADSNAKRVNRGGKIAAEFLVTAFVWKTIQPIERKASAHQRISFRYDLHWVIRALERA